MPDLLLADLLLAGGGITMTGMSAMAGAVAYPLVAGSIIVLIIVLMIVLGWHP